MIEEIQAMVKTNEDLVESFIVREATPERIKRLYAMPELQLQPTIIRENGLIFAGQGSLLTFKKPSDIVGKISKWFPKEYAAAQKQTKGNEPFFGRGRISLFGPYPSWQDEPAAFLTLWECMPQIAWAQPTQNPFMRRLNDGGLSQMTIAARSSNDTDFKRCIYELSSRIPVFTQAALKANERTMQEIGVRVAPILQRKFADFLASNRCRGMGPDDCVLLMLLWSSLSPTDVNLIKTVQALESEVAPDGPLPALQKPAAQYEAGAQEGERHFDEALRKAAFLHAKLTSIIGAPDLWAPHTLNATMRQMSNLWLTLDKSLKPGWEYYKLDNNKLVNPWGALLVDSAKRPDVQAAVFAELQRLASSNSCGVMEPWLKGRPVLRATFALNQLKDNHFRGCISPDWNWLQTNDAKEASDMYQQYLGLLHQLKSGIMHEVLLSQLTDYGKLCFDKTQTISRPGLDETCRSWISEPQTVPFKLKHTRLTLSKSKQFQSKQLQLPVASVNKPAVRAAWLIELAKGMNPEARQKMQDFAVELQRRKGSIDAATWWTHPHHGKSLVELRVNMNDERFYPNWSYTGHKVLFLLDREDFTIIRIPLRFFGEHRNADLVHVSDVDNDGNLEAWWAASFRQCKDDETDLERELDCSAKQADMGEIKGDSLTYFSNRRKNDYQSRAPQRTPNAVLEAAVMPVNAWENRDSCNTALVGSVLEKKLKINFQSRAKDGDVISLVCKPHPQHPDRTIVALFHDLKTKKNQLVEYKKGFVFGVINVDRSKIHSLYRENIEEDASIRIDDGALEIDTARYNLAPGVRALGVRMNIGYSPRYAEGGQSGFLTLFTEQGQRLRPVLKNLPMSVWSLTQGSSVCNGASDDMASTSTIDQVGLTLAVSDNSTNGWRDLEVTAQHQIEKRDCAGESDSKPRIKKQALSKLRWNGKTYGSDHAWISDQIWPSR